MSKSILIRHPNPTPQNSENLDFDDIPQMIFSHVEKAQK